MVLTVCISDAQAETITVYRQNLAGAPVTSRQLELSTAVSLFNKQSKPNVTQNHVLVLSFAAVLTSR